MTRRVAAPVPPFSERAKPGLSKSLEHARRLDTCQSCGTVALPGLEAFRRYREFDEWDKPTMVVVVLCESCAARLVKPHARIYEALQPHAPHPGSMPLCVGCTFERALGCTHAGARVNGGPGLALTVPKQDMMHLNYGGGRGEFVRMFKAPVRACSGRAVRAALE